MLKVLWLCSWYPNNISPFDGDFVQRHAQVASLLNQIHVIKLTPDHDAKNVTKITKTYQQWPNLTETFVYYPKPKSFVGKTVSYLRWYSLYKYAIENYITQNGKPDLVHVHIPFKSGLMAKYIKRKYNIPYVVTEHWGGYNDVLEENYYERPRWFKNIIKESISNAAGVHSVSRFVEQGLRKAVRDFKCIIIPNAVNDKFFFQTTDIEKGNQFKVVHISNGAPEKNLDGIIETFENLDTRLFGLTIVGLEEKRNKAYQNKYPFINFVGQVPYSEVAQYLQQSHAMVIFSHIENSPCVICEALSCGTPVIATNVGGIPELVDESNSILIEPANTQQLSDAIVQMCVQYENFDTTKIASEAKSRFSYEQIAKDTTNWYHDIMISTANSTKI